MASKLLGQIAIIEWEDAWASLDTYFTTESIKSAEPLICHTVGFVIRDSLEGVTLAQAKDPGDSYRGAYHIPRKMVRKIRFLK